QGRARRVDFAQQPGDRRFLAGRDDPGPDVLRPEPVRVLGLVPPHVLPAAISTEGLAGPLLLAIGVPWVIGSLHGKTPTALDAPGADWRARTENRRSLRAAAAPRPSRR